MSNFYIFYPFIEEILKKFNENRGRINRYNLAPYQTINCLNSLLFRFEKFTELSEITQINSLNLKIRELIFYFIFKYVAVIFLQA